MKALVVGNREDADPGLVGERLKELGFSLKIIEREYPRLWSSLAGVDLVLSLGSEWSVYSLSNIREVAAEVELIESAIERGTPIFAICFGAQLISHALGGKVFPASQAEIGWHSVSSTEYGEIFGRDWMQWHRDIFTVPEKMRVIAENSVGPQAMLGRRVLATQFHPEATSEIIARWSSHSGGDELRALGIDPKTLVSSSLDMAPSGIVSTNRLVDWFLEKVSSAD